MNENEHIKLIESALSDIESRVSAIHIGTSDLGRQLAEAEQERDFHRDDAAMVRRERDTEINRLAGELAKARSRAERFAQALLSVRGDVSWASVAAFLQDGDLPEWADPDDAGEGA